MYPHSKLCGNGVRLTRVGESTCMIMINSFNFRETQFIGDGIYFRWAFEVGPKSHSAIFRCPVGKRVILL